MDWLKSLYGKACLLGALAFGLIVFVRAVGWLQPFELIAYDRFLDFSHKNIPVDDRIVIVRVTEADLHRWGFPLSDQVLSNVLEKLEENQVQSIGVDIYRDIPVPPGTEEFTRTLKTYKNIFWIMKLITDASQPVYPPEVLKGTEQVGFNDLAVDDDGIVRQGILYMSPGEGQPTYASFPMLIAYQYLAGLGFHPGASDEDPRYMKFGGATFAPLTENFGGYIEADVGGFNYLIDYQGLDKNKWATLTVSEVLDAENPIELVKGKIVLIGTSADSVNDDKYVPLGNHIYGIDIHAYQISHILRAVVDSVQNLRSWSDLVEYLWLLAWIILSGICCLGSRSFKQFITISIAGGAILTACCYIAFLNRLWIPIIPPLIGYVLMSASLAAYMSSQEKQERKLLMNLFSRHVSSEIAEVIWTQRESIMEGNRVQPQRVTATVFFSDLVGFTPIAEKLSPTELMDWLNVYMESMSEEVFTHHGVVDKYMGDAIMALFGVPFGNDTEQEIGRNARNAVLAAVGMSEKLKELNPKWQAEGLPTVGMRVGIFTGSLVAGSVGGADMMEYTVLGDTVNTAARLESYDKDYASEEGGCRILIGETTKQYLGEEFVLESAGKVSLKGKAEGVEIFLVKGIRS